MNRLNALLVAFTLSVIPAFPGTSDPATNEKYVEPQKKIIEAIRSGQFQDAENICSAEIAEAMKEQNVGMVGTLYGHLASAYRAQGRNQKAIDTYKRAIDTLSARKRDAQANRVVIALFQNNIGETYTITKDFETALPYLLEAKAGLSKDHPAYVEILQNLGRTYVGLKKHPEAEGAFKEAISAARQSSMEKSELNSLYSLGLLYSNLHRIDDLRTLLDGAIPFSEKIFGESDNITKRFRQLTFVLEEQKTKSTSWEKFMEAGKKAQAAGDYQKAISEFSSAAKEAEKVVPASLSHATALLDMAACYFASRQFKEAEENATKALSVYERYFPEDANEMVAFRKLHAKAKELAAQATPDQQVTSTPQAPAATK